MALNYDDHIQSVIYLLYVGIALVFLGLSCFQISGKSRLGLLFLVFGSFSVHLFLCLSDPFLHMWDEQFHAVVAKNMLGNPLKPMLIENPILPYNYKNWTGNHIWLHKQPLFLWQIALSFKLFGTGILSLRLPSMLMTSLLVFPVYRIGKIVSGKQTGFYAAVLLSGSNFIYQLSTGRIATDHNDTAFLFYVTLSIWAWFEKEKSDKKYWVFLIGLFSGAAILNKWLVGLLVYSAWGLHILLFKENRRKLKLYAELVLSLAVTAIVALPWQLYIFYRFPKESSYEFNLNMLHFTDVIEGHTGGFMYHFNNIEKLYGTDFQYVIILSLIIFLTSRIQAKFKFVLLMWIFIVYAFYSFAATKLSAFSLIVAPLIYIIVAQSISQIVFWAGKMKVKPAYAKIAAQIIGLALVFFVFFHFLNHNGLSLKNNDQQRKAYQFGLNSTLVYKEVLSRFKHREIMVFNTPAFDKFKIIFMSGSRAGIGIPSKENIQILKSKNILPVLFDNDKLPGYILNDSSIAKIRSLVWQTDFHNKIEIYY
ncbi:MAG: glycosyltransferase family 39 protein [Bacteroidales bacterium]|nr:glycosyltransferase family 39 protein [Bacteroidales bacterium]